jgi:hypothetical protein
MASVEPISLPQSTSPAVSCSGGGPADTRDSPPAGHPIVLSALFLACLAFLLASFPARNSDLWMSLARGRAIVGGAWSAASSSWLYDVLCYGMYSLFGGTALVIGKALVVVVLGLVLFRLCGIDRGWWLPAVCSTLALLAMSTRLALQPATVSYLFLALTLWFLQDRKARSGQLLDWRLLILFVAWANMDRWFLLGLATVALVYLGRLVDAIRGEESKTKEVNESQATVTKRRITAEEGVVLAGRLAISVAVLTAACLINPAHFRALARVGELVSAGSGDPSAVASGLTSPFQEAYLMRFRFSPAGLAYYPLLGLGLLSFIALLPRWSAERLFPWLGLAALSVLQVRTIGFFAVVCGPVMAWNLREVIALRFKAQTPSARAGLAVGRMMTVLAGIALIVFAWPGRLQAPPFEPRRWGLDLPRSLELGAQTIQQWRKEGKLVPDSSLLHLRAESANAFAWFAPEEKGVVDPILVKGLHELKDGLEQWRERMRSKKVAYVVLYGSDRGQVIGDLTRLLEDPGQWPLLYVKGGVAIFGWRDPDRQGEGDPFGALEVEYHRTAFGPGKDEKVPRDLAAREPEARQWWHAFWKPMPPPSVDREEATLRLIQAEVLRSGALPRHLRDWDASLSAALVAASGAWQGPGASGPAALVDGLVRLVILRPQLPGQDVPPDRLPVLDRVAMHFQRNFILFNDQCPPAVLYLAVRAARRSLAVNPNDAGTYLVLGETYLRFLQATRDRMWGQLFGELLQLRRAQASTALNQAVALQPDLIQAHASLAWLYEEMGYFDLRLQHLRMYQQLRLKAGPRDGEGAERFRDEQSALRQELEKLVKAVEKREDEYLVAASGRPLLERAIIAKRKGLAGKARDMLLESIVTNFGPDGMAMELELMLHTGRARDVWEWTGPEQKAMLGPERYHMLRCLALAATGDYARAEEECTQLNEEEVARLGGRGKVGNRDVMALLVGQAVLDEQPSAKSWAEGLVRSIIHNFMFLPRLDSQAGEVRKQANRNVLRGLLFVEEGEIVEAEIAFRDALDVWKDRTTAASGASLDFNSRHIAQAYLSALESAAVGPIDKETGRQGDKETRRNPDKKSEGN